jgi:probable HAF family extracellular repeat protein
MTHGYVLQNGGVVSVDFPAATYTSVFGINAGGRIVGRFVDANGRTHAYVARPMSPE